MSDNSETLARIDERTEQILASLPELKRRSERLDKAVFIGNSQPALLGRVGTLETQFAQFMVIWSECRRAVHGPSPAENKPDTLGRRTVDEVEAAVTASEP